MVILALVHAPAFQTGIRKSVCATDRIVWCSTGDQLLTILLASPVDALLVEPWDRDGFPVASLVSRVRSRFPSLPVLACCPSIPDALREMIPLARAGIDDVLSREDDIGRSIHDLLSRARARRSVGHLLAELEPEVATDVMRIVACCLERAERSCTVEDVARALGVSRRTLVNRLAARRLPPPSAIIGWCRLLTAARLLEEPGRTVEQVALALEFGSGAALSNMFLRYVGLRPAGLRERGTVRWVATAFKRALRVANARLSRADGPEFPPRHALRHTPELRAPTSMSLGGAVG